VEIYHTTAPDETFDFKTARAASVYQELFHVVLFPHYGGALHG
jgi:hypothetical protein